MSTTRDDLFHAILATRDDDAPRLVYADFLEEHGELPRAMLIRHQCALAQLQPWDRRHTEATWAIAALLAEHGPAWRAELPALAGITWGAFERGFCAAVAATGIRELATAADAIARAAPVIRADLDSVVETTEIPRPEDSNEPQQYAYPDPPWFPAAGIPWLRVLRLVQPEFERDPVRPLKHSILSAGSELELDPQTWDRLVWLERRPADRPVSRIAMSGEFVHGLDLAQRLAAAPWAQRVHTLLLGTDFIDMDSGYYEDPTMREAGARILAEAKLAWVTRLSVSNQRVGALGLAALLESMPRLTELAAARCEIDSPKPLARADGDPLIALDLGFNTFGDAGAEVAVGLPRAAELESLTLRACGVSATGLDAISRAPCWQTLRAFDLGNSELGVDGAVVLSGAPEPSRLATLKLDDCDLTADAARLLTGIAWLRELFALDLGKNPIDGCRALLAALADSEIAVLGLRATGLTAATTDALAPAWARLRTLDLRRNANLGDAGFAALVSDEDSPIVELDLSRCGLTPGSLATFARMRAPQLRVLKLAGNPLGGEAGAGMLGELVRLPMFARVAVLDVSNCGFGIDLPAAFEGAGPLPVLHDLGVRGESFEIDVLRAMQRACTASLPNLARVRIDADHWELEDEDRDALTATFGRYWWFDPRPSAAYGYPRGAELDD